MSDFSVIEGDCVEVMRSMEEASVDAIVTDPPAGISFMSAKWDSNRGSRNAWIAWLKEVMEEAYRVMKPGAHGLVWALPRTSHWTAMALENAGFEIRDRIAHHFGSGFPKSASISKHIDKVAGAERDMDLAGLADNARNHFDIVSKYEGREEWALSVNSIPDLSAEDIARRAAKPNKMMRVSTVGAIEALACVSEVRPDWTENGHANIVFHAEPTWDDLVGVEGAFSSPVQNPGRPV